MKLFREIGLSSSIFLVIGNVVGIGIFTTPGLIAQEIGSSIWLIAVWVLGGFLALVGAVCYSLLGVRIPRAGGEYAFLYPSYGPLAAFLSGWTSLVIGFSAPIAAAALGLVHYLSAFLPLGVTANAWGLKATAVLVLVGVTIFLSLGLKFGVRTHLLVTILNLVTILGFAGWVLWSSFVGKWCNLVLDGGFFDVKPHALGSAVVLVMFAYSGWNAAVYISEEIRTPERTLPRALILGTLVVMVSYALINLAYFSAAPLSLLEGEIAVAAIAASTTLGKGGPVLVNALISLSILSSLTAMSIAGPRVYFAMSRDGLFPGWLCEVHEKRKLSLRSIWFQSLVAVGLIVVGTLSEILLYSGFILLFFATLTVSTLLRVRKRRSGFLSFWFLYRVLPALFVVINLAVPVSAVGSHPSEALVGLATVALGLPVYLYYKVTAGHQRSP